MSDYMNSVLLVGCGYMGQEYCKVLRALQTGICAVGRGVSSAESFCKSTGIEPHTGGLTHFAREREELPDRAIIAVDVEELFETVKLLLNRGVKTILVEKPGAVTYEQIQELDLLTEKCEANVFVAYNRRFYASVRRAQELITEDGGVSSFRFEFTEWGHKHLEVNKSRSKRNTVFLGNSTHVLDLAFYLGGVPENMTCYTAGDCSWCDKPSRYSGAGITKTGACFSYFADWDSAGRWSVEILTPKRKLILCPLEELRSQLCGTVAVEKLEIDDELDCRFKPGLYLQTEHFLRRDFKALLSLGEHRELCKFYRQIEEGAPA